MSAENGVIDATAVDEPGTELVPAQAGTATLFRTDDPVEVIQKATAVANALKGVVQAQGLIANIGGKEHPQVEAWQTLGAMLGVSPNKEWVRPVPWPNPVPEELKAQHKRGLSFGYEASFLATRADGGVIGGGEAMCTRSESKWRDKDDYALRSMAQTRATSKALAAPLRFVMTLAGYSGTPAEEMDGVATRGGRSRPTGRVSARPSQKTERVATAKQRGLVNGKASEKNLPPEALANMVKEAAGMEPVDWASQEEAESWLRRNMDRLPARAVDPLLALINEAEAVES